MNQTINNYEILPTSSFFNFSDILTIGTIIAAFITLYFTIRNNNKTLKKTLEYETNRRKLLEFNEIAVSVKEAEYELKRLYKMFITEVSSTSHVISIYSAEGLFEVVNSMSDKVFFMESQFDLKSYNKTINMIYGKIDQNKKEELFRKLYILHEKCVNNGSEKPNEKTHAEIEIIDRINGIREEGKGIAEKELKGYLDDISIAKEALVAAIAEINTSEFN